MQIYKKQINQSHTCSFQITHPQKVTCNNRKRCAYEKLSGFSSGSERYDPQKVFYEIISCHDARRTFITCSLALGIPENFVRKCSGHKDLRTMAPYMGVGLEAQTLEMEKWDKQKLKSQIISLISNASEEQMAMIIQQIQPILQKK